ncbi:UDP-N-acetylmuramoyl-tripeptide--D-alanyl-D-alanine ligase [Mangrovimonas aestuarii]|uniref:UDP-N-acetylmuramoyl-tripeptide--D-alanyl-D- alanine ligase n=1 Tax=Mangrovimonas aestuarii TaxID=3018443 RepID=UPI0023799A8A|nr:UDP-N-acetylmuramoyl-tripeptide--D-alanyl-D-alanine ligase [Mangrovimonas aestuarii]
MKIKELHQLFLDSSGVSTDTRKISKNSIFFALKGDNFDGNTFAQIALNSGSKIAVIDDPDYCSIENTVLVKNTLETLQELATFHRDFLKIPIIALTGSNGKTTTKELINVVLSKKFNTVATVGNLNNHIGVPLTLLSMDKTTEVGIVEMGANHLKEIELLCKIAKPNFGYITNFGKAHLEGFGGVEGVIKGKSELYEYLIANDGLIFINADDSIQLKKSEKGKIFSFSTSNISDVKIQIVNDNSPTVNMSFQDEIINSNLIGLYNANNIAAALAIGNYFKISVTTLKQAIESYIPSNNRSQIIKKGSTTLILDAYNANPTSMEAALSNLSNRQDVVKIAILGDMFELGQDAEKEHQYIADLSLSLHLDKVILIGANFSRIHLSSDKLSIYESFKSFKEDINTLNMDSTTVLIKGSRGMALERIIDLI